MRVRVERTLRVEVDAKSRRYLDRAVEGVHNSRHEPEIVALLNLLRNRLPVSTLSLTYPTALAVAREADFLASSNLSTEDERAWLQVFSEEVRRLTR